MHDLTAEGRLLLGTVGWERDDWLHSYYPSDLPPEWRLAYYANDCGCVVLAADSWCDADYDWLEESLDEGGGRLRIFLQQPTALRPDVSARLALFGSSPAALLVERPDPAFSLFPQWVAQGPGAWVDPESGASLLSWSLDMMDPRQMRVRAESLESSVQALVLDGPAASPGRISELRILLELMGKA